MAMTSTGKIVVGIIVIIIIAVGAYYWYSQTHGGLSGMAEESAENGTSTAALSTSPSDTSDAALTKDVSSIDAQMNGLQSDNAEVDNSLNAQ